MIVLHPTDFSACAGEAEKLAARLARDGGGELVLIQVLVETPLYAEGFLAGGGARRVYEAQRKWAQEALQARADELGKAYGIKVRWLLPVGAPFAQIVQAAADEHADMIVMGTHGRTGLNRLLLGSVAERVIRLAPCPVVTVRETAGAAA